MRIEYKAFLDMIARAEGTILFGDQDGYNVIVGGRFFDDYSQHPMKIVWIPRFKIYSSAAGRYQLLARYWKFYQEKLHLPDFGPASQDAIALQQLKECKALGHIDNGQIAEAIRKANRIWASLPGSPYGQSTLTLAKAIKYYDEALEANNG